MWGNGNTCALLSGMETGISSMENMEIPQKIKNTGFWDDDSVRSTRNLCLHDSSCTSRIYLM